MRTRTLAMLWLIVDCACFPRAWAAAAPRDSTAPADSTTVSAPRVRCVDSLATATKDPEHRAIAASYRRAMEAYENKDLAGFFANKTQDFTAKSLKGQIATRDDAEEGVRRRFERIKYVDHLDICIRSLEVKGKEATAITVQEFSRVVTDPEGKEHTFVTSGTVHRDSWVKTTGGWMIKGLEELEQGQETMDGKSIERRRR